MQEQVVYEEIVTKVVVHKGTNSFMACVGMKLDGKEVFGIHIINNTDKFFSAAVLDEDGYDFCRLSIICPDSVRVCTQRIAVDGPAETK